MFTRMWFQNWFIEGLFFLGAESIKFMAIFPFTSHAMLHAHKPHMPSSSRVYKPNLSLFDLLLT